MYEYVQGLPSPCELQLLKPRQPQLASWICSVRVAFAFQASHGSDAESQKSPFEAAVRIKASWRQCFSNIVFFLKVFLFQYSMNCLVLFAFVLVAVFSSFSNISALDVHWSMRLLFHILTSSRIHHSRAPRPAALLSNCPQGLAETLRLNQIVTKVDLFRQNIDDEQVKAPGQTAAFDLAIASCQLCRLSPMPCGSTRP